MIDRCQHGRTGISASPQQCTSRAVQGSIFCKPHRNAALQRQAAVPVKRYVVQRWQPPSKEMRA